MNSLVAVDVPGSSFLGDSLMYLLLGHVSISASLHCHWVVTSVARLQVKTFFKSWIPHASGCQPLSYLLEVLECRSLSLVSSSVDAGLDYRIRSWIVKFLAFFKVIIVGRDANAECLQHTC